MSTMNDYELDKIAESYAEDILSECNNYGSDPQDMAWEYADGSEHVIYHHKAHRICQNCNTDNGEQFLEDLGGTSKDDTYDSIATKIAFGELYSRILQHLHKEN